MKNKLALSQTRGKDILLLTTVFKLHIFCLLSLQSQGCWNYVTVYIKRIDNKQ